MSPSVILYRYAGSPFCKKVENALLLKGVLHHYVDVAPLLPRPEITKVLGIAYRRLPILAIGRDIYCDSSLIMVALERHVPPSAQHGTFFPKVKASGHVDTGFLKAFTLFSEAETFLQAANVVPWADLPAPIVHDRSNLFGAPIDTKLFAASASRTLCSFTLYLHLLEEQLNDNRDWLFSTECPGLADISLHVFFSWLQNFPAADGLVNIKEFPLVIEWLARFSALLRTKENQQAPPILLSGDQAADIILSSNLEPLDFIGFDSHESSFLGVRKCDTVSIAPTDTGKNYPTVGKLVALSRSEIVIEVAGAKGTIRCHFPRLNFSIKPVEEGSIKTVV